MIGEAVSFKVAAMLGRLARLDEGSGSATILAYGTDRPAMGAAPGASALSSVPLTKPAGTVNETTGALVLTAAEDGLNLANGEAKWCRVVNGAGAFCFDMDAAEVGSPEAATAEAIFADTQLYEGGALRLISCVLG